MRLIDSCDRFERKLFIAPLSTRMPRLRPATRLRTNGPLGDQHFAGWDPLMPLDKCDQRGKNNEDEKGCERHAADHDHRKRFLN